MAPRTETQSSLRPKGTRTRFGSTVGAGQFVAWESATRSDQTGPGDNAPLTINKWTMSGGVINNDYYSYYGGWFQNYIADGLSESNFPHIDVSSGGISNVAAATMAAARTSPSAAYVDATANALEVLDIAQLIKSSGEYLIQRLARNNLRYQFGIKPLIGDIVKLLNFNDQVQRRVRILEKLRESGTYRKTVDIVTYTGSSTSNLYFQSADALILLPVNRVTNHTIRAHCRWTPATSLRHMDNDTMLRLAQAAVVNRSIDFASLWEALPWSWLLDWCGNVGTFLKANRNTVPATLDGVSVMRHTRTVATFPGYSDPSSGNRKMTPGSVIRETKLRQTSFVSLTAQWPFLSANQMGILASLSVR
jgi:hypothetical protein